MYKQITNYKLASAELKQRRRKDLDILCYSSVKNHTHAHTHTHTVLPPVFSVFIVLQLSDPQILLNQTY